MVKRLKKLKVNHTEFKIVWDSKIAGGWFNYPEQEITIGTKGQTEPDLLMIVCHELWEICSVEMSVRLRRPDVESDYIFVYDHRQFDTMASMFAGLLQQFIK